MRERFWDGEKGRNHKNKERGEGEKPKRRDRMRVGLIHNEVSERGVQR